MHPDTVYAHNGWKEKSMVWRTYYLGLTFKLFNLLEKVIKEYGHILHCQHLPLSIGYQC